MFWARPWGKLWSHTLYVGRDCPCPSCGCTNVRFSRPDELVNVDLLTLTARRTCTWCELVFEPSGKAWHAYLVAAFGCLGVVAVLCSWWTRGIALTSGWFWVRSCLCAGAIAGGVVILLAGWRNLRERARTGLRRGTCRSVMTADSQAVLMTRRHPLAATPSTDRRLQEDSIMSSDFNEWKGRLQNGSLEERLEAAEHPPHGPDKKIIRALAAALQDDEEIVRTNAAEALAMFAYPESLRTIRQFVDKEADSLPKSFALSTLGLISEPSDIPALLKYVDSSQDEGIQQHAAMGLFYAARRAATFALCELLHADMPPIRNSSAL